MEVGGDGWRWVEMGGDGWRWVEAGRRLVNGDSRVTEKTCICG